MNRTVFLLLFCVSVSLALKRLENCGNCKKAAKDMQKALGKVDKDCKNIADMCKAAKASKGLQKKCNEDIMLVGDLSEGDCVQIKSVLGQQSVESVCQQVGCADNSCKNCREVVRSMRKRFKSCRQQNLSEVCDGTAEFPTLKKMCRDLVTEHKQNRRLAQRKERKKENWKRLQKSCVKIRTSLRKWGTVKGCKTQLKCQQKPANKPQ